MDSEKISFKEKASFLAGGVGKDMACGIVYGFYTFYLTAIQGLDPLIVGVAFFFARIWDAVNDPMMGFIVDNTRTKIGKFRPWIGIGTLLTSVMIVLMFLNVQFSENFKYIYYIGIYVLWSMAYTLMDVPYWSMLPVLAKTENERNSLSTWTRLATGLGGTMINTLSPIIIIALFKTEYNPRAYFWVAIFVVIGFLITEFFTVKNTREKVNLDSPKIRPKDIKEVLTKNDQMIAFFLIMAVFLSGTGISGAFNIYYFSYDLGLFNVMGVYAIACGVFPVIFMTMFPILAKKFSRRRIFITALIIGMSGYLGMFFMGTFFGGNLILLGIFNVMVQTCSSLVSVLMTLMLADTVDYGELKLGFRTDSIVFSLQPFLYKFSSAVSALVLGIGLKVAGIPEIGDKSVEEMKAIRDAIPDSAFIMIRVLMFAVPIIFLFFSLIIYIKKFNLNGDFLKDVNCRLEIMRAQKTQIINEEGAFNGET